METKQLHSLNTLYKVVAALLIGFVATCLFSACSSDDDTDNNDKPEPPEQPNTAAERTVIVYMVAENTLSSVAQNDITEMVKGYNAGNYGKKNRMVIYVDDLEKPRVYVLDKKNEATSYSDLIPVMTYDSDVNSASAEELGSFIEYVQANYPSSSYGLVLWSHGTGWIPSFFSGDQKIARRAFGIDNGGNRYSDNGNQMEIADLARVLEEKGGVDYVLFDACFMQSIEIAVEMANATKSIIASPAEIPSPGANYTTLVDALFATGECADSICQKYYQEYSKPYSDYGIVISRVNTSALPVFVDYMRTVLYDKQEVLSTMDISGLLNYFRFDSRYLYPDICDMQGVMKSLLSDEEYALWLEEVAKVVLCYSTDTWYSMNGGDRFVIKNQCSGLSMFLPLHKYDNYTNTFNKDFLKTKWAKTVWCD